KGWPRPSRVPAPVWAVIRRPVNAISSSLTIGGLPPQAREILGLPWDETRERRYRRFAAVVRALRPVLDRLPARVRLHPIPAAAFRREGRRP
ncbi:oxygenase MpaB family protein, partial [Nocardioides sp.]|uniref:oxygenase MpaB family protein n=1 Tax=Nocardioides sp. TaxID=35761 RepID=UPI0027332BFB